MMGKIDTPNIIAAAPKAEQWLAYITQTHNVNDAEAEAIGQAIVAIDSEELAETPIYLRALTGIGAVISSVLLIFLLYLFGLFSLDELQLSIDGLVMMGFATVFHMSGRSMSGIGQDFLIQIALTLLQAGKLALITGLAIYSDEVFDWGMFWPVTAVLGIVGVLSFAMFPSSIERFVAAFSFLISLWVSLLADSPTKWEGGLFTGLVLLHIVIIAAFLKWGFLRRHLTALYDALLVSLCVGVGIISTHVQLTSIEAVETTFSSLSMGLSAFGQKWPTQIALTAALIGLILWVAGRHRHQWNEPIVSAIIGVCLLTLLSDPGILLALGLMMLGYATHRPAHSLLGLGFAVGFGFNYYYNLDLTLLQKSAVLIASGLLFLVAAAYIRWRGWYRREPTGGENVSSPMEVADV